MDTNKELTYFETKTLLRSWKVGEETIQNFIDNDISIEKFQDLTDMYLKELCPHIGNRIALKTHIHEFLDSVADTDTIDTGITSPINEAGSSEMVVDNLVEDSSFPSFLNDITNFLNRPPLPDFDINTLLSTTAHGNSVLNYYKKFKMLNAKKRNILVDIVVKHIYTYIVNNKLMPEDYNLIAAKIVTLFPSENTCSYFVKAVPTSKSSTGKYIPAKGKLVDKVRNLLYISGEKHRTPSSSTSKDKDGQEETLLDVALDDDILWLQTHNDPWDQVTEKWNKTLQDRVKLNKAAIATVEEALQKWPILKDPRGHVLINTDFEQLHKEKSLNFFKNWQGFFSKLLSLKRNEVKNSKGLQLLETLDAVTDEDKKIPVQMTLLGYLVPPKGRFSRKIKYSSTEAIQTLIVQANGAGDIDKLIQDQKAAAKSRKQSVQPYVIVLGSLHNFLELYIVIDEVKYAFQSAGKAFDNLFKTYHVLHAKYPLAGDYLYLIIQLKIYDIKTPFDVIPPYIVEILNL